MTILKKCAQAHPTETSHACEGHGEDSGEAVTALQLLVRAETVHALTAGSVCGW